MTTFNNPLDTWNRRFSTPQYIFGETPNVYLQRQGARLKPGSALSVADGEGRNGVWLAEQGLQVDAFDFSPLALDKARNLAQRRHQNVHWQCSDWQSFGWKPAHYDNVVGIFFQFANPDDRAALFAQMDASLKPGGVLIIQGYSHAQLQYNTSGPGKLDHLYDEQLMRASFPQYELLDLQTYEEQIDEGTAHAGMSGLLGMTARKR